MLFRENYYIELIEIKKLKFGGIYSMLSIYIILLHLFIDIWYDFNNSITYKYSSSVVISKPYFYI